MDLKFKKLSFQVQKLSASVLHLIFLILMLIGIELMYLNDNFGTGITRIQNTPFENTKEFDDIFNQDLNDIFHFIEYNEVFSTKGSSVDISKVMLQMTFGPDDATSFTLGDMINYLQSLGYELNDSFECKGYADPKLSQSSPSGYVAWSASEPKRPYSNLQAGLRRASLEEISLEIMAALNRYYTTYQRLFANGTNLHFKIEYFDSTNPKNTGICYTNAPDLSVDNVKNYGRYAYLAGNSVFYDTNFKTIALNTISSLAANNPYKGNSYYLLAAVDTLYPAHDHYFLGHRAFLKMQHHYITGFVFMLVGGLISLITLLFLIFVSGYRKPNDRNITLHRFDQISTESGVLLFAALTFFALFLCRFSLVRIAHLILPQETWELSERLLYESILYLGILLLGFSLLRRYKAGNLWTNSLIYKCSQKCSVFLEKQDFSTGLAVGFLSYFAANTLLLSMVWILSRKIYLNPVFMRLLLFVPILVWIGLNFWVFYILYEKASERNLIHHAIEHICAGETNYQVDLSLFQGKEQEIAENLNHISTGLETALQEKVKSERLKADLITNVSHDIKTPLTSIINYVDLIKREHIEHENLNKYLNVLEQKAQRLKTLTEDLVEASKASSGTLTLEINRIDFIELIYQTNGEFEEKFSTRNLQIIMNAPEETLFIEADGRRLWRVLENLYNNAFKYALENSRIYIDIEKKAAQKNADDSEIPESVVFTIKNISANPLNIRGDELTERFVRGDVARTTEGSGLGLSIARSLTELQKGTFDIYIDGDLFKARIAFPVVKKSSV